MHPVDVDHLDLAENEISVLTGLQRFKALQSLTLSNNALSMLFCERCQSDLEQPCCDACQQVL